MSVDIRDLLHRRTDLSTFLVHLTKDGENQAKDNLTSILKAKAITAGEPMGWAHSEAEKRATSERDSQRVVCFTETPLEHVYALFADIKGRTTKLAPYGVAFTKIIARGKGANPVWYVDMTPTGRDWVIASALDKLRARALRMGLDRHPAGCLFPFIEGMGDWTASGGTKKEFWWEREWRYVGDFTFTSEEVALVIAPEADHAAFEKLAGGKVVDGTWSLERIIANLTKVSTKMRNVGGGQETPVSAR